MASRPHASGVMVEEKRRCLADFEIWVRLLSDMISPFPGTRPGAFMVLFRGGWPRTVSVLVFGAVDFGLEAISSHLVCGSCRDYLRRFRSGSAWLGVSLQAVPDRLFSRALFPGRHRREPSGLFGCGPLRECCEAVESGDSGPEKKSLTQESGHPTSQIRLNAPDFIDFPNFFTLFVIHRDLATFLSQDRIYGG